MSSKQNTSIQTTTNLVTSSIEKHAIPAAEALDAAAAEGEQLGLGKALAVLATQVARESVAVDGASKLVRKEVGEDKAARTTRDGRYERARTDYSLLANNVSLLYGREYASLLGLTGSTPETAASLVEAIDAFAAVSDPLPELPAPRTAFASVDIKGARTSLVEASAAIKQAVLLTTNETRETQAARAARDRRAQTWQRHTDLAVDISRAVLIHQGQHDLADRMFPAPGTTRDAVEDLRTEPALPQAPADPADPA